MDDLHGQVGDALRVVTVFDRSDGSDAVAELSHVLGYLDEEGAGTFASD